MNKTTHLNSSMNIYFDIFWRFLYLGCVSFGGPAAHIGYFQNTFVFKLKWLDINSYGRIVALSQFLPGPGSSQVGFAIGLHRAGVLGGIMAFLGFTLPSFLLMWLLAVAGLKYAQTTTAVGIVYGLKLLAVVVVADAVIIMAKSFCQRMFHRLIAILVMLALVFVTSVYMQILAIGLAALLGVIGSNKNLNMQEQNETTHTNTSFSSLNIGAIVLFCLLFIGLPFLVEQNIWLALFNNFYQAGSLVFGGGHVVMPLLEQTVGQQMTSDQFLTGYAAAQGVPGPMFTLASFLGSMLIVEHSFLAALVATLAIFLPGFLLLVAFHRSWHHYSTHARVSGALTAINAAVVGILAAALYQPIAVSAIGNLTDVVVVLAGFALLKVFKLPIVALVVSFVAMGIILTV